MTTADAIMLTLYTHGKVRGRTKLLRHVTELPIDAPIVQGEFGLYPENGFDVLEMLDNFDFIIATELDRGWEYEIADLGKMFVDDKLKDDVSSEEWELIRKPLK